MAIFNSYVSLPEGSGQQRTWDLGCAVFKISTDAFDEPIFCTIRGLLN